MEFYAALRQHLQKQIVLDKDMRSKVSRVAAHYLLKDNQLFYIGPGRRWMRLVVLSDEKKRAVLEECHIKPGTGNHNGVRATRTKVIGGYYWSSIKKDVADWVKCCHRCQLNYPIKKVPPVLHPIKVNDPIKTVPPVLHPIKVEDPWEVVGMDLIGPLRETGKNNKYIFTMTDLFTKWVVAEPLQTKSASEVAAVLISKLYLFGMVRKIISDQGREFVDTLNSNIFKALNIKHAVSSAYHPQTNGQDECTNQNLKRALRKYVNEEHGDWDVHLQAIVHGINTTKERSTQHSPYFLLFHRHPRLPEVLNECPMGDVFEVQDPEEELDRRLMEIKALNEKVLSNIERAQSQQKKSYSERKRKGVRQCSLEAGDEVLIGENPTLQDKHQGPFTLTAVSTKGVATVRKGDGKLLTLYVSRLRPYNQLKGHGETQAGILGDHNYAASDPLTYHQDASHGPLWPKDLGPLQNELLNYVLDEARPAQELIVRVGPICLTREDFWSLGLRRNMDSNIGSACFKIIEEAAQRHGKDVHTVDMYTVPTWKTGDIRLPFNFQGNMEDVQMIREVPLSTTSTSKTPQPIQQTPKEGASACSPSTSSSHPDVFSLSRTPSRMKRLKPMTPQSESKRRKLNDFQRKLDMTPFTATPTPAPCEDVNNDDDLVILEMDRIYGVEGGSPAALELSATGNDATEQTSDTSAQIQGPQVKDEEEMNISAAWTDGATVKEEGRIDIIQAQEQQDQLMELLQSVSYERDSLKEKVKELLAQRDVEERQRADCQKQAAEYKSLYNQAREKAEELSREKEALLEAHSGVLQEKVKQIEELMCRLDQSSNEMEKLHLKVERLEEEKASISTECEQIRLKLEETVTERHSATQTTAGVKEEPEEAGGSGESSTETSAEINGCLVELRHNVARLLLHYVPLELDQVNYECNVIDEILEQVLCDSGHTCQ